MPMLYRTLERITTIFTRNDILRKPVIFSNSITTPNTGYIVVTVLNLTEKTVTLKKEQKIGKLQKRFRPLIRRP